MQKASWKLSPRIVMCACAITLLTANASEAVWTMIVPTGTTQNPKIHQRHSNVAANGSCDMETTPAF